MMEDRANHPLGPRCNGDVFHTLRYRPPMTAIDRSEIEREIRRLCAEGAIDAATVATIRTYGTEILGFLRAQHPGDGGEADEVFSVWSERLFRGLAGFDWGSSLRTWAYTIARNASINFVRGRRVRARHEQGARSAEIVAVEQQVRTATPAFMRTEAKSKLAAIREALSPEDQKRWLEIFHRFRTEFARHFADILQTLFHILGEIAWFFCSHMTTFPGRQNLNCRLWVSANRAVTLYVANR